MSNIVVLNQTPSQEVALLQMGFTRTTVFLRQHDLPVNEGKLVGELIRKHCLQFQVTETWRGRDRSIGAACVVLCWTPGSESSLLSVGFHQAVVLIKSGSSGMTVLATPKDEKYMLAAMSDPPDQWYAGSWWAPSRG